MIKVKHPKRWDKPFDDNMSDEAVARILSTSLLNKLNAEGFNSSLPLASIIKNDTRIVSYQPNDVVVRKGEYGGSVFLSLSGEVCAIIKEFEPTEYRQESFSFFKKNTKQVKSFPLFIQNTTELEHLKISAEYREFLQQNPEHYIALESNSFYGEMALVRGTRQATLFAQTKYEVLEIRWQGLRDLMRYDAEFSDHIQGLYKQRGLLTQFRSVEFFSHLKEQQLRELGAQSLFISYGEFEWQRSFKNIIDESSAMRLQAEPVIAKETDYVNGVLLICSGFARLSKKINHGEKTLAYLKKGDFFGFDELAHNWRSGDNLPYQHSLRAIGRVDLVRIPTALIEQHALPHIVPSDLPPLFTENNDRFDYGLETGVLEQLVEQRFINGTSTMVIDQYRCTGCDDCVNACASLHDNQPRFKRSGKIIEQYLVTHACMHCTDPVCLIGCPTGAIHRSEQSGDIIVDDSTCIGCSGCATNCPYENIFMTEVHNQAGQPLLDEQTGMPILKASKCDLCAEYNSVPACEQACPHDALKRLDIGNIASLADWFNR